MRGQHTVAKLEARQYVPSPHSEEPKFIGRSKRVLELLDYVDKVAATDAPVLITGESGTGKEILARVIHARSNRCDAPYVAINCGAIADTLEESELFGHVRGAFTGAERHKLGRFEAADHGTVFLDEIAESSPSFQVKLLRILQDGEYAPVGLAENRHCDVRVVAATNRDLSDAVQSHAFRSDLYYRLNVIRLHVPPLRERKEDIPPLARHFVQQYCHQYRVQQPKVEPRFYQSLIRHDYPGNVRELSNYIHRAVVLASGGHLSAELAKQCMESEPPATTTRVSEPAPPDESIPKSKSISSRSFHHAKKRLIEEFEREYLLAVLTECGGIISRAAKRSGLSERSFHHKLKNYGIEGTSYRDGS